MLRRSTAPEDGEGRTVAASPFGSPHDVTTPEAHRDWLRRLYRSDPRAFASWAREALGEGYCPIGDDWMTATLYDALCRVARSIGLDIGEPLAWVEAESG